MKASEIVFDDKISNKEKFGVYLRSRRLELGIGLREFAEKVNLSPAYISDIENGIRLAPINYLKNVIDILLIDEEEIDYFYDLAGSSHSNWPDINEYLAKTPIARKAIRLARDKNISQDDFAKLVLSLADDKENSKEEDFLP